MHLFTGMHLCMQVTKFPTMGEFLLGEFPTMGGFPWGEIWLAKEDVKLLSLITQ